ncbi:MAG: sugar phosphate isomerase/epimerase family protein [Chloroflexota bacterium]
MKLSIVTDEISSDVETALEIARSWGVDAVELRGVAERRYPNVSDYWRARVPELLAESGLGVAAISPGLFKIPYPTPPPLSTRNLRWEDALLFERGKEARALVDYHLHELLPAAIGAALELRARTIVCFSFDRAGSAPPGPTPDAVVQVLRQAAETASKAGLMLAMEVEHVCWGDVASRAADIARRVDHPSFGINWDPANDFRAGDDRPFPDGYQAVRPWVRHVHFKDAHVDPASGQRGFTFAGVIDWKGQVEALKSDGYDGYISVETHGRPKVEMSRRTLERLRRLVEDE